MLRIRNGMRQVVDKVIGDPLGWVLTNSKAPKRLATTALMSRRNHRPGQLAMRCQLFLTPLMMNPGLRQSFAIVLAVPAAVARD